MNSPSAALDNTAAQAAGPSQPGGQLATFKDDERVRIPAKWRLGQAMVIGLIILFAIYYNTIGWHSPAGESRAEDSRTWVDQAGFLVLAALVWLTTPNAGVIALTTFQEAVRRRWMSALLGFALIMLALSTLFTWMQPGEEEKFLRDFGVGFIIIMTLLMAIFLGVALVPPEIERRTIFTILSKPVNRLDFLIGKYLGLSLTLFVNLFLMGAMFLLSYAIFKIRHDGGWHAAMLVHLPEHPGMASDLTNLARAVFLHFGQLSIMAALALTMSLVVTSITAIVFCFLAYFGGQMSSYWEHLAGVEGSTPMVHKADHLSGPAQKIVQIVSIMLPRLEKFDVRQRLLNDMPVAINYMWKAMGSGLIYVAVMLTIAYLVFEDREF